MFFTFFIDSHILIMVAINLYYLKHRLLQKYIFLYILQNGG